MCHGGRDDAAAAALDAGTQQLAMWY